MTDQPPLFTRRTCLARSLATLAAAPTALTPLTALAQPRAGERQAVTINMSFEPESLDPTMAAAAAVGEVTHYNVFEGLTKIEESGAITPLLAESWQQDPGGLAYTFRLRQGVRFHDGAVLDASAVRFSWERSGAPGSTNKARKALFDNIASIGTPDAHTVVLTLHRPDAHLLFRLGENTAVVLHPDSAAQAATDPVGTGPYRVAGRQPGHSITLAKTDTYRQAASVSMARATFRFLSEPDDQLAALRAGEIDLFFHYATQSVNRLQDDARYQLLIGSSGGKGMLALNHRRKPLNDLRVRRAITHAIDREAFIRTVLEGRGTAIGSHFAPTDAGYVHLATTYPYDPDRARALLKQAGVGKTLALTLSLPPAPYARAGGEVVAAHLAQVGITARIEKLTWPQWLAGPFKGRFDMTIINHVEPLDYLIYTDPNYYFGYDSPAFRELAQRHAAATSARERQVLFAALQRHLAQDAVNAWIFAPKIGTVVRKGLHGAWMNYPIFAHDIGALHWA
jgi:peptide/nickel transport system substrate-binding protein